jgi:hypothetical protein
VRGCPTPCELTMDAHNRVLWSKHVLVDARVGFKPELTSLFCGGSRRRKTNDRQPKILDGVDDFEKLLKMNGLGDETVGTELV